MGEHSAIAWTEATWNPWIGCTRVSPGCAHCYMFRLEGRWGHDPAQVRRTSVQTWALPLRLKRPSMLFTCSMSDFFHEDADAWRDEAWNIMRRTPQHVYQVLTKRAERIAGNLPGGWPFPNVWLGVSVENQWWADRRIPLLLSVPAEVRFLSCEPLLKPIDLRPYLHGIQWCICGGESGPDGVRREMKLEWARDIQRQCEEAGVALFFKQVSARSPGQGRDALGHLYEDWPPVEIARAK